MASDLSLTNEQALAIDKTGGIAVEQYEGEGAGVRVVLQDLSEVDVAPSGHVSQGTERDLGPNRNIDPLDLAAVIPELRRPFTPAAVKWKVQAAFGKPTPHTALIVGYIDARLVVERLNLVCPGSWCEGDVRDPALPPFAPVPWSNGAMLCRLTVCNVSRQDIGFGRDAKAMVSDALKRAAVKFGIGVSVYGTPQIRLNVDSGYVKVYGKGDKQTLVLTDGGKEYLPKFYTRWLWEHGVDAFGLPLDHGDSALSVGDVDSGLELGVADDEQEVDPETQKGLEGLSAAVKGGPTKGTK
jgi:hypothetical protein